ncbi:unnamed protein product [Fraxinus pennsylvanica]|uniref:Uncharacterized protein n=1 Tax=Fraxinus pennsylvanica TaxID=56036 RepID=A0AAD2EE53_9LAMI|nr:unnamed protein product [Fraxinus pennsylvanica]
MEKSLDKNGALAIIRNAADVVWVGVDLYCKWQDKDLRKTSLQGRTSKETLEKLSNEAERTVKQFLGEIKDFLMDNPLNWPQREIPNLDPDKAAYNDEWRTFIREDNVNSLASISSIGSETQQTNE